MFGWTLIPPSTAARGFSLVELLVTCSILAALAFTAWGTYTGIQDSAEDDIALTDLRRLADAVRRFKRDTGYYPGAGPFFLSTSAQSEEACSSSDGILRSWATPESDADRDAWFASPANLAMLFDAPRLCSKHPQAFLQRWNADSRRGWHGPYLDRNLRLWTDHGADLNTRSVTTTGADGSLKTSGPDGFGSALAGAKIADIPGYGSGPRYPASSASTTTCSGQADPDNGCMLGWRSVRREENGYNATQFELPRHARPFLFFGLSNSDAPRVVYFGKDGRYGGRNVADPCRPNLTASDGSGDDDHVLCLEPGS